MFFRDFVEVDSIGNRYVECRFEGVFSLVGDFNVQDQLKIGVQQVFFDISIEYSSVKAWKSKRLALLTR